VIQDDFLDTPGQMKLEKQQCPEFKLFHSRSTLKRLSTVSAQGTDTFQLHPFYFLGNLVDQGGFIQ
jgi:hypothetical protein